MTDEQKKLVEENHALIYQVIRDMGLPIEEHYDLGAIGLCKAAIHYKSDKTSFSTFAYTCIKNEIMYDYRTRKYKKRAMNEWLISYETRVRSKDGAEELTWVDQLKSDVSVENEALSHVMYTELIDQLGKTDSKVIPLFRLGLKQREIAEIMGVTQANISRVRRRIEKIVLCE